MTTETTTLDRLGALMRRLMDAPEGAITRETKLVDDLHCDSFDRIEIVMAAEEEFEIELSDAEMEGFVTVADFTDLIDAKIRKTA